MQLQPLARQAIKHLVADGRYDYIETGSLLSIRKNVRNIVIPSEETKLRMNPMDYEEFRWAMGDTVTVPLLQKAFADNIIYQQLLSDKLATNLGYVYENAVAQMLRASGNELYYHTFPTDSGKHNYEIDFLLARHNKICPVEVKSSGYKAHASLQGLTCLPFYMTQFI